MYLKMDETLPGFQNVNPERGRKHEVLTTLWCLLLSFQNVNPERGRKLLIDSISH